MSNIIVLTIGTLLVLFCIFILIRNQKVYQYKIKIVEFVYEKSIEDANKGKESQWRWEKLDEVSYHEMMYKFWKPLDSFYKDKRFFKD